MEREEMQLTTLKTKNLNHQIQTPEEVRQILVRVRIPHFVQMMIAQMMKIATKNLNQQIEGIWMHALFKDFYSR